MATYRMYFRDDMGLICGREDFDAESDAVAAHVAAALFDACSDCCFDYEIWEGTTSLGRLVVSEGHDGLAERMQDIVIRTEEALQQSAWRVAESQRLLDRLDGLRPRK